MSTENVALSNTLHVVSKTVVLLVTQKFRIRDMHLMHILCASNMLFKRAYRIRIHPLYPEYISFFLKNIYQKSK